MRFDEEDLDNSTLLTERWKLEFSYADKEKRHRTGPILRKIKLKDIVNVIYVLPHSGGNSGGDGFDSAWVDVVYPKYRWAHMFGEKETPRKNTNRTEDRRQKTKTTK
jgi:hypothetical protein